MIVIERGDTELAEAAVVYTTVALSGLYTPAVIKSVAELSAAYVPTAGAILKKLMDKSIPCKLVGFELAEPVMLNDLRPEPKSVIFATSFSLNVVNFPLIFAVIKYVVFPPPGAPVEVSKLFSLEHDIMNNPATAISTNCFMRFRFSFLLLLQYTPGSGKRLGCASKLRFDDLCTESEIRHTINPSQSSDSSLQFL